MRPTRLLRPLGALTLLVLAGCPHPQVARPYAPPKAAELVAHLATRAGAIHSLRADTKVDYLAEKGDRIKVAISFLVAPPDRLHMDAESPLGGSLASLATDGKTFALLDARENRFLTGEAAPCNIARLIRVELKPADAISVLEGGVPLVEHPASEEVGWDPTDGGREVLTQRDAAGRALRIWFAAKDRAWDVVAAEMKGKDGAVEWRLENEDFSATGALRFPGRTTIVQPARKADARIRFRSREVNVDVPEGAFRLEPPAGLTVETVSCGQ